jgi:hypothetical protein
MPFYPSISLEMMIHLIHRPVLNKYVDKQSTNCCLISSFSPLEIFLALKMQILT